MIKQKNRKEQTRRRHQKVRLTIKGTSDCPRLAVYRSTKHIYAQIIDDTKGETIVSASTVDKDLRESLKHGGNIESAKVIGKALAQKALKKKIKEVLFDRGGFLYHGRVAALADAAREAGLEF